MKRWIVNAAEKSVRLAGTETLCSAPGCTIHNTHLANGEFFYDAPTPADAMAAGARRRLAEEALDLDSGISEFHVIVADRIEPRDASIPRAAERIVNLQDLLQREAFDVWREGSGLVVLGRLPSSDDEDERNRRIGRYG